MDDSQPLAARDRALLEALPGLLLVQAADGTFLGRRGDRRELKLPPDQSLTERLRPDPPPCPTSPA